MKRVLVLGGSGLVGKAIINEVTKSKDLLVSATYFRNKIEFDQCTDYKIDIYSDEITTLLDEVKPRVIISCLRGDFDKQLLLHIKVAKYLKDTHGILVFCSTGNVFDEDLLKPHYEKELLSSYSSYGKYKIECEKRISKILKNNAIILRFPQVWSKDCRRIKDILEKIKNKEAIITYPNLIINISSDVMIGKKVRYILENGLKGIFHIGSTDMISHKDLYEAIIKDSRFNKLQLAENLDEKGYFALLSNRANDFPKELNETTKEALNKTIK